jgi:molecular chaperone GrpE
MGQENTQTTVVTEEVDYKDKYVRLLADMDNLRKNSAKQISSAATLANEKMVKEMLPCIDAMDIAVKNAVDGDNGYEMLRKQLLDILAKFGVQIIEVKENDAFDDAIMNAILAVPSQSSEQHHNTVSCVTKKGYTLNGNVIRYADVIVYSAA